MLTGSAAKITNLYILFVRIFYGAVMIIIRRL